MHAYLNFTEGTLSNRLSEDVLADFPFMRLQIQLRLGYPVHDSFLGFQRFILNFLLFYYFLRWILNLSIVFVSLVDLWALGDLRLGKLLYAILLVIIHLRLPREVLAHLIQNSLA